MRPSKPAAAEAALRHHGARVALAVGLALLTYLFFPASPAVDFPIPEVGAVAAEDVIAPFAFRVRKSSSQLVADREVSARTAVPVYGYVPEALDSARRAARALLTAANRQAGAASFTAAERAHLEDPARRAAVEAAALRTLDRWMPRGIAAEPVLEGGGVIAVVRANVERLIDADSVVGLAALGERVRASRPMGYSLGDGIVAKVVAAAARPSMVLNAEATTARRRASRAGVPQHRYEVRHNERLVSAHEVVGPAEYDKLRALRDELATRQTGGRQAIARVAGSVLFNSLVIALFGVTLVLFRPQLYQSFRALVLFAALFTTVLAASAVIARLDPVRPELIPIALAAVIISVLFDPRISMIAAMVLAVLVGGQSVFRGTNGLFINLIGGTVAAFSVRSIRRRNDVYASVAVIAAAYLLAALAIGLTLGLTGRAIVASAAWGATNAAISVVFAMALLPLAEEYTGIDTYLKLLEWSDLNRPLMQRLMLEAPGTYNHTVVVANLSEAACNAIGANGLLARVGTYYHDIGKLKKPQFFVENQQRGRNPHDKLKPATSASIIRHHVTDGLEFADEYKLPRAVRAFITEHHGTATISYFLDKAQARDATAGASGDFAYPGPLPQSAETAVVMLADGVEAATRVLSEPTPQRIRDVIDHIVRHRIEQGQLRDAPLTLRQLETVKDQFARMLIGQYHNRIDYPTASGGVSAEFASV